MDWGALFKTLLVTAVGALVPVIAEQIGQAAGLPPGAKDHITAPAVGGAMTGLGALLVKNPWR